MLEAENGAARTKRRLRSARDPGVPWARDPRPVPLLHPRKAAAPGDCSKLRIKSVGESAQIVKQQPARRLERAAAASGPALDQVEWYALAGELDGVFMAELVWREAASDERGLDAP